MVKMLAVIFLIFSLDSVAKSKAKDQRKAKNAEDCPDKSKVVKVYPPGDGIKKGNQKFIVVKKNF